MTAPTQLTALEGHRLDVAFSQIPYSGTLPTFAHGKRGEEITIDDVVEYLGFLRDELLRVSARQERLKREVLELETQRDGARAFLGLDRILDAIPGA